jgi:mono/diheme cytochrome c family protein
MKNFLKLICTFVFITVFVFFWSIRTEASKANVTNLGKREAPRTLYLNNCARCHGADGTAQTELGRLNDTPDISGGRARKLSAAKITRLITNGKGSMPGFGKKLNRAQISSIAKYVRGL